MAHTTGRAFADRLLESGWLASVFLVPLVINPWGLSIFSLPKALLLRTLVFAMLAVWLVDRLTGRTTNRRPAAGSAASSRLVLPAALLIGVIAFATALAPDPALSFWGSHGRSEGALTLVCLPVLMLLVAGRLPGPEGARRVFWVAIATVLPLAVHGGVQLLGPDPLGIVTDARSPVFATLGRSNFLGAYLAMLFPLTVTLAALERRRGVRVLVAALGVVVLGLLLATQARAAWLAVVVASGLWAGLFFRDRLSRLARNPTARALGLTATALAVAAGLWLAQTGGSGAARIATWQGASKLIVARPFLGYGPDSLGLVFPRVYPPELVYYQGRDLVVDRAHNVVLDWTLSLGVLGLFAGAAVLFVILRSGWRALEKTGGNGERELLVIGALSAIVGNVAGNLVAFDVLSTLTLSWLLAGAVVSLERSSGAARTEPQSVDPDPRRTSRLRASVVVVVAGMAAMAAIAICNVKPLLADVWGRRAEKLALAGEWSTAIEAAEQSVKYFPEEPVYRQQLGWIQLQAARATGPDAAGPATEERLAAAERELSHALAQRPDDYQLARTLAEFHGAVALQFDRRHLGSAEESWKKTTELAPNHGILYGAWGRLRLQTGDAEGAKTLLEKAVDLDATDAETWLLLADLELQRQEPTSALVMYRRAARHAPDRAEPLVGLARTYWLLGQPEAARQTVLQALELDPQNGAAAALQLEYSEAR